MTTTIERIARAIDPDAWMQHMTPVPKWVAPDAEARQAAAKVRARAVLEAIRKPTEAMKDQGFEQFDFDECGDDAFHKRVCGRVFEAMIDAALNDGAVPLTGATP